MNNRKVPAVLLFVVAIALLIVFSPVAADHNTAHIAAVDAKLTQYIRHDSAAYERDADISALRWQAMAAYYEKNGLLTRDGFDYAAAEAALDYRWQAMAAYYEQHGLLTRDDFDYAASEAALDYRWQAMADYYEQHGLLTRDDFDYAAVEARRSYNNGRQWLISMPGSR
jgi:Spy/CpxP family protein refolding chaperone